MSQCTINVLGAWCIISLFFAGFILSQVSVNSEPPNDYFLAALLLSWFAIFITGIIIFFIFALLAGRLHWILFDSSHNSHKVKEEDKLIPNDDSISP